MRLLVTGGAGFIGSACVRRLTAEGHDCVVLDNFDELLYGRALKQQNLAWARRAGEVRLVEGDVRDAQLLQQLFAADDFDAVLHLAALAGVRPSIEHAERYYDVNVTGTQRVLTQARAAGVARFVVASSSSVYGANEKTPFAETDPVDQPVSPYAASKRAMEILCGTDQALHGGDITALRFFTVYGPRQRPEMAIHKFMRLIADGDTIPMFGDGSTGRDYTFIDDIVDGVVRALYSGPHGFRVYNLGGDEVILLRDLIDAIGEVVGETPRIERLPLQPGDVPLTNADLTRSRSELGYEPQTSLRQGLATMWRWFNEKDG